MIEKLDIYKEYLEALHPIQLADVNQLLLDEKILIQEIKKDKYLLQEGENCNEINFILKGSFRQFSYCKGEEVNFLFYFEGDFAFDHNSYLTLLPSQYNLKGIEDSIVLRISKSTMDILTKVERNWSLLNAKINEKTILRLYKRNEVLLTQTPEERYVKLLEVHPQIIERVSLTKIATFLGITVPSLSRIRKRIAS